MKTVLHRLNGNEPMGLLNGNYVTAKVRGKWYQSLTIDVKHSKNGVGSDSIEEAVDLSKPLTDAQLANHQVLK